MKNIIRITVLLPLLLLLTGCPFGDCDCPEPQHPLITQYQLDKKIVEINTTNVSTGLESVFKEKITDSTERAHLSQVFVDSARFYNDKSGYFFIETLNDAWVVAHINHDLIGTSRIDIQDENGKYFIKEMVETVKFSGYGFVEYHRKNPASNEIERKMSFVTSIKSPNWFIGTGFYGNPPEIYYDNYEANTEIVRISTETLSSGIGSVIENYYSTSEEAVEFCRTFVDHIRYYDDGSGYFFIVDLDGVCIANGIAPEDEGQDISDLQDSHGNYFIQDMIFVVSNQTKGTIEYYWTNPITGEDELKSTYVTLIPGTNYFIGSGFYVDLYY